jgi:hypothetical protein
MSQLVVRYARREEAMSHTPGPWHAEFGPQGGYVISDDERGHTVCLRSPWPMRMGESEANARLIAAAPDLLSALEALVNGPGEGRVSPSEPDSFERRIDRARRAIAKAKGEGQ